MLKSLVQIDYSSKRLIGATSELIMEEKFEHFSSISHYMQCMALLKYQPQIPEAADASENPDKMLMDKVAKLINDEPRIHPIVSVRLLWSLYAIDYAEKETLLKL